MKAFGSRANTVDIGNKKDNVTVIYTPWSNLKKDGSMAVGQVGFHNQKLVCSFGILVSITRVHVLLQLTRPHFK